MLQKFTQIFSLRKALGSPLDDIGYFIEYHHFWVCKDYFGHECIIIDCKMFGAITDNTIDIPPPPHIPPKLALSYNLIQNSHFYFIYMENAL